MNINPETPLFTLTYGQWMQIQDDERRKTVDAIRSAISDSCTGKRDEYAVGIKGLMESLPCTRFRAKSISVDPLYSKCKLGSGKSIYFNVTAIRRIDSMQSSIKR